ncbi:MAG: T9SS type A sorting domain-containing protein [Bacteroidota bacterium]|nr:T9SS type A sorting domain-containing protein [Bacteroidota bacterium]
MKHIHILALLLSLVLFSATAPAQPKYGFTYDASGNRLTRAVVLLKSATICVDTLQVKQAEKPLNDQIGLQKTRIYPNPTKGLLLIDFPELSNAESTISVFDPSGKLIVKKSAISNGNEVDLSAHPPGFYIMVIHIGQEKKEWKIIKE